MKIPHCIRCEAELPNLDQCGNQPGGGLEFLSQGHYGTTVFDPMDGTFIAINVCDKCLAAAKDRQDILFVRSVSKDVQYETWK
jgi:hypothetical protein